jgi:hypothetical protein
VSNFFYINIIYFINRATVLLHRLGYIYTRKIFTCLTANASSLESSTNKTFLFFISPAIDVQDIFSVRQQVQNTFFHLAVLPAKVEHDFYSVANLLSIGRTGIGEINPFLFISSANSKSSSRSIWLTHIVWWQFYFICKNFLYVFHLIIFYF